MFDHQQPKVQIIPQPQARRSLTEPNGPKELRPYGGTQIFVKTLTSKTIVRYRAKRASHPTNNGSSTPAGRGGGDGTLPDY